MKNQLKAIKVLIVYNESLICVIKVYVKTWIGRNDLSRLFRQFEVIIIKKIINMQTCYRKNTFVL